MPKRSRLGLAEVASFDNLARAFALAARGKRDRPEVQAYAECWEARLQALGTAILDGTVEVGRFRSFDIRDPKPRTIHAPVFEERVLHHAVMAHVGPILDRRLVHDTYACRTGKGALAAVKRAQHHARRFPFFVKIDIRGYFASIHHDTLLAQLARVFKDPGLLGLFERIVRSHHTLPGRGLPIGALTSQHFANTYLAPLDRFLAQGDASAMIRYMDDAAWWCPSRSQAWASLHRVGRFVEEELRLTLHPRQYVQRSAFGMGFLGFRVLPGVLLLSNRRRDRFRRARDGWERAFVQGRIGARELQAGAASAFAIIAHADAAAFRRSELQRRGVLEA